MEQAHTAWYENEEIFSLDGENVWWSDKLRSTVRRKRTSSSSSSSTSNSAEKTIKKDQKLKSEWFYYLAAFCSNYTDKLNRMNISCLSTAGPKKARSRPVVAEKLSLWRWRRHNRQRERGGKKGREQSQSRQKKDICRFLFSTRAVFLLPFWAIFIDILYVKEIVPSEYMWMLRYACGLRNSADQLIVC